jgi:beta-lactamase class A
VPILVAFFQDVDAGKIRLDEKLTMKKELIAQGSGDMQYLSPGTQFTALETATKMITISDNTATNMLIQKMGGLQALNNRFKSWGLSATVLRNVLPDLQGTNTTSPKELASLMVRVSQGELVTLRSRDRLLDIMRRTVNNSQLPQGLGEGATIAHKTGDIGSLIGDVGLVDMPNGKRYAAAVLVKRGFNDDRAYDLIQKISRVIYQHLNQAANAPTRAVALPLSSPLASDRNANGGVEANAQVNSGAVPKTPERPGQSTIQAANP